VAADLLQSCATRALAAVPPSEAERIRPWLFTILRNVWIDEHRRVLAASSVADAEPMASHWRHDDRLIAEITVRQAFDRIEPAHREILELIDLAGFRYGEAAEILAVPIGTVMSRLSRARLTLLEAIEGGNLRALPVRARQGSGPR
jgi:RNA polymerase sigma-70 factor (ECF subfamily)